MSHTLPYTKNKNLSLAQNKVFWSGAAYQVLYTCVPWIFPWYSLFLPSDSGWYTPVRSAVPLRTGIPYRTVCHHTHPAWAVFHARLLDNQEGANTEPYVFGTLSARFSQRRPLWHRHYSICGDVDHDKIGPGVRDIDTPSSYAVHLFPCVWHFGLVPLPRAGNATL